MAPSSAKRRSARKRESTTRQPAANSSATNSPSRPTKRRKTAQRASATSASAATAAADHDPNDPQPERSDDETSEDEAVNAHSELADRVAQVLEEAHDPKNLPNVCREHSNEYTDDAISAYAKIAGRTWTYFVVDTSINIGRCPDIKPGGPDGNAESRVQEGHPHIDMAPNKHVSRLHARVFFDPVDEHWHLEVHGRNGVRINDALVRKNQHSPVRSGDVLKVDETEMIFVLPSVPAIVQQQYMDRLNRPAPQNDTAAASSSSLPHSHPLAQSFQPAAYVSPYAAAPTSNGYHEPSDAGSMVAQGQLTPARGTHLMHAASSVQKATPQRGSQVGDQGDQQIDYSDDSMRDMKPPMSYATLIAQAILAGPNEKSSLNGIYEWIKSNFAYYRYLEAGWQNSIRHNLSLNQSFLRVGRDTHEPGKGGLWYIAEDKVEEYRKQGLKMTSRGGARQASNPASPVPKRSPRKKTTTPPRKTQQGVQDLGQPQPKGTSSLAETSASVNYGDASSHTPMRPVAGTAAPAPVGLGVQHLPQLSSDASPLPARRSGAGPSMATELGRGASASRGADADAPPTSPPVHNAAGGALSSSSLFGGPGGSGDGFGVSLFTPAPQRHEPRMTAPSTAKLPSKYLPQSSPAPFWKSVGGGLGAGGHGGGFLGTPGLNLSSDAAAPADSPVKHDPDQTRLLSLQSSSPPPASINGSPTRARPKAEASQLQAPADTKITGQRVGLNAGVTNERKDESEEEDEQLDLMGSFPGIGESGARRSAL